jgi:hypothetical protein
VQHLIVEQDDVGSQPGAGAPDLPAIRGLSGDLDAPAARQRQAQHLAEHLVIVGDQNPDHRAHWSGAVQASCQPRSAKRRVAAALRVP